jgi:ElaB/YqjD/DUF883 family membrane-anchored ribosome-binding protein
MLPATGQPNDPIDKDKHSPEDRTMAQARSSGRNSSDTPATDRLASMAHDTVDRVAETANYAEQEVRSAAGRAAEHAREMQEQARAAAQENVGKARSFIEENPLMSAGIAFAAGVVFSALIRR